VPNPMRAKTNFTSKFMLICPVQSLAQKYFGFSETKISLCNGHPVPHRGALANVTNAGRDAVDAAVSQDE
jgi:hypothetical protein